MPKKDWTHIAEPIKKIHNNVATKTFGMTVDEALEKGICINCKKDVTTRIYSLAGNREYYMSGLCELCFDQITGG